MFLSESADCTGFSGQKRPLSKFNTAGPHFGTASEFKSPNNPSPPQENLQTENLAMLEFQSMLIFFGASIAIVLGVHVSRPLKATNPFGS